MSNRSFQNEQIVLTTDPDIQIIESCMQSAAIPQRKCDTNIRKRTYNSGFKEHSKNLLYKVK